MSLARPALADRDQACGRFVRAASAEGEQTDAPLGNRVRERAAARPRQLDRGRGGPSALAFLALLGCEPGEHGEMRARRVRQADLPRERQAFRGLRGDAEPAGEQSHQHIREQHVRQLVHGARRPCQRDRSLQQLRRPRLIADRLRPGRRPDDPARLVELIDSSDDIKDKRHPDRRLAFIEAADAHEQVGEKAARRIVAPRERRGPMPGVDRARRVARPAGRFAGLQQHLQRLAGVDWSDVGRSSHENVAGVEEHAAAKLDLALEMLDVGPHAPVGDERVGAIEEQRRAIGLTGMPCGGRRRDQPASLRGRVDAERRRPLQRRRRRRVRTSASCPSSRALELLGGVGVRTDRGRREVPRPLVQSQVVVERVGQSAMGGPARARGHALGGSPTAPGDGASRSARRARTRARPARRTRAPRGSPRPPPRPASPAPAVRSPRPRSARAPAASRPGAAAPARGRPAPRSATAEGRRAAVRHRRAARPTKRSGARRAQAHSRPIARRASH